MITTTDQLNRSFNLNINPQRIVSLVPSLTELLYDLGLRDEVIGITKFCVHPEEWYRTKTRIGGTKNLNIEKIRSLNPDLIIANKEENDELQVRYLMHDFPVWMSDISNLEEALQMILEISSIVNCKTNGENMVNEIETRFKALDVLKNCIASCAYLIWKKPLMTAGGNTYISSMLKYAGYENVFVMKNRYPEITLHDLQVKNPEFLLLSSEPYPFKEIEKSYFQKLLPSSKVIRVDGEMFSWYGSHLLKSPDYFKELRKDEKGL